MKTCMFTGMFRKRSFREAIENAAEIGYDGVEIRFAPPHMSLSSSHDELLEYRRIIEASGLAAVGLYSFSGGFSTFSDQECEKQLDDVLRVIEVACILDTPLIKINSGGPNAFLAQSYHFEKSAYWLNKCGEAAALAGKKITLEIHNGSLIEDVESALRLIDKIGCDNVGLIHDAGNMYITGTDYGERSVKLLGKSLFHVHIKDVLRLDSERTTLYSELYKYCEPFKNLTCRGEEEFLLTALNMGGTDHIPLLLALEKTGYTGYLSTEANLNMNDREMAQYELSQLKAMLSEIIPTD